MIIAANADNNSAVCRRRYASLADWNTRAVSEMSCLIKSTKASAIGTRAADQLGGLTRRKRQAYSVPLKSMIKGRGET